MHDCTKTSPCVEYQIHLENIFRFHIDLEPFANIVRIDRLLHDHHAFRSSHPMMQDDFHAESLTDPSLAKL